MTREEFMDIVYSELYSDGDNYRANRIIDAADEYAEDSRSEKPNYTDAEIQKMQDLEFAEIQKAYEIGKEEGSEVLDKIRAEIVHLHDWAFSREGILRIIDKYKASPTGEEVKE